MARPPKPPDREPSPRFRKRVKGKKVSGTSDKGGFSLVPKKLDPHVSMQQQRLIGRVIVVWSRFEGALQTVIWDFLRLDMEDGRILTSRNDVDTNIVILQSLGKRHVPKEKREEFKGLIAKIKDYQEDRNFIAHGQWGTGQPGNLPAASSIRKRSDPEHVFVESFSTERMLRLVKDIQVARDDLVAFGEAFLASHDKPHTPPHAG